MKNHLDEFLSGASQKPYRKLVEYHLRRTAVPNLQNGTVKLSRILGLWRRNRSALELRIDNLGSVQGAEQVLRSGNLTVPLEEIQRLCEEDIRRICPELLERYPVEDAVRQLRERLQKESQQS